MIQCSLLIRLENKLDLLIKIKFSIDSFVPISVIRIWCLITQSLTANNYHHLSDFFIRAGSRPTQWSRQKCRTAQFYAESLVLVSV